MARLYMVATPIGNLEDITYRALSTFKAVELIACEDTRHTLQLLTHFGIQKPLVACHAYEEEKGARRILKALDEGKDVAYASDAGTPGLSDPGALACRLAREAGHQVVPIPGPSALAALVSVCGFPDRGLTFDGFLSPKPGRRRGRLAELLARPESFMVYESPHRILKLLADIAVLEPERELCVGRELTKLHEELLVGTAGTVMADLSAREKVLGEFAVLVSGARKV